MKIGGPEGMGEGQSFVASARQKELQELREANLAQQEQAQSPEAHEARENQIARYMSDFDRMALSRSDEEIHQLITSSNTNVGEDTLRGEAYSRWKAQRNVTNLNQYREDKAA